MTLSEKLNIYYSDVDDEHIKEINFLYYETLYQKYLSGNSVELVLKEPGKNNSKVIPFPIASDEELELVEIQEYEDLLEVPSVKLREFELCICKMQAGLGTSVRREDLLKKFTNREELGSKGTDLFINYEGQYLSIAEVQLLLAEKKSKAGLYKAISFQNLLNSETEESVNNIWNNSHPVLGTSYQDIFDGVQLHRKSEIHQLMMPTIDAEGSISFDRLAPGGHAFLGFFEMLDVFRAKEFESEIKVIGNGEDLKSTPDDKILSWVADSNIPLVMITTTKLEKDKKGGQLAIVNESIPYITIVEKAQAQRASQLELFEELGLRDGDKKSLFNTNIVIINKRALKEAFEDELDIIEEEFIQIISPDLIKNIKEQDDKKFVQLEGAIGSLILNLDKYFRQNYDRALVSFLNLGPGDREKFFLPIKKREDFDEIYGNTNK